MAVTDWYNDNSRRAFPFMASDQARLVADAVIVDVGFLIGPLAGFTPGVHAVYLKRVRRLPFAYEIAFGCDAPGLLEEELVFYRQLIGDDDDYLIEYADTVENDTSFSSECPSPVDWSGFLVTGDLTSLATLLPLDDDQAVGRDDVEPALVRTLSGRRITSVNVANVERTRYAPPTGCQDVCWPFDREPVYVVERCLVGPVRFREGYNAAIQTSAFANAIVFNAAVAGGEGEPCDQSELFPGESPPGERTMLDGSLNCAEVVRTINGVGGKFLPVVGGLGVSVQADTARHRLIVDVNTSDMAVCADMPPGEEDSAADETSISCDCGPAP